MFDSWHSYIRKLERKCANEKRIKYWVYTFKAEHKQKYICIVEQYPEQILVVKFYSKNQSNSRNRYSLLTGNQYAPRIISTCLRIMLDFYVEYPAASFAFIGANNIGEPFSNTKRFRIYRNLVADLFGPQTFTHIQDERNSAYMMINNTTDVKKVRLVGKQLLTDLYPDIYTND